MNISLFTNIDMSNDICTEITLCFIPALYDRVHLEGTQDRVAGRRSQPWVSKPAPSSRQIIEHKSEWGLGMNFWDEVGSLIQAAANRPGHQGVLDTVKIWKEERKRIEKLRFWDEVKGKHGFPQDIKVWHVHPLGWVENFVGIKPPITIEEARIRAFMRMIRRCEGTTGQVGYETLYGGSSFIKDHNKTFADHPEKLISAGGWSSTAAGAYQVMKNTWKDTNLVNLRGKYNIKDFSPESQDIFCLILLRHKLLDNVQNKKISALHYIKNGDFHGAIYGYAPARTVNGVTAQFLSNTEWASLPGSPYNQNPKPYSTAKDYYEKFLEEELEGESDIAIEVGAIDDFLKG
jgi:muramidase (phage lysozyme)